MYKYVDVGKSSFQMNFNGHVGPINLKQIDFGCKFAAIVKPNRKLSNKINQYSLIKLSESILQY